MDLNIYRIYGLLQPRFRSKRMRLFLETFRPEASTRILDVGGNVYDWEGCVPIDSQITVLNLAPKDSYEAMPSRFHYDQGDGCHLPYPDQSFDIVYSNSVIEHLKTYDAQRRFASEMLRVGKQVYVQTPNRWFPVEPHFVTLFLHFLPKRFQWPLLRFCSVRGLLRRGDNVDIKPLFDELRLLSGREMKNLFPGCEIYRERLFGLNKAYIAIRKSNSML